MKLALPRTTSAGGFCKRLSLSSTRLRQDLWLLDAKVQPDALEEYRKGCAHLFDITLTSREDAFSNRLEGYNLGGVVVARCVGVAQRFKRGLNHILSDGGDSLMVAIDLDQAEWRGDYDGRAAGSHQGQIRIVDMARPFDMETGPYRTLYLMVPRALLDDAGGRDLHGLVVSENGVSGQLLGSHLRALDATIDRMTQAEADGAVRAAAALIAGAILAHAEPTAEDPRPVEKMLLASGRQFIQRRLDDSELSPETVRKHLGISRSLLYRAFEPVGGVSAFIQARRLDQAFDAILQDNAERHTLGEIGYRHGFRSDAHFSRAFRARFGVAPGRLRKLGEAARLEGLSALERPDGVWTWLRSL
jgi:AraC-like DNA-binding protein